VLGAIFPAQAPPAQLGRGAVYSAQLLAGAMTAGATFPAVLAMDVRVRVWARKVRARPRSLTLRTDYLGRLPVSA
jgi:hypothetical protein